MRKETLYKSGSREIGEVKGKIERSIWVFTIPWKPGGRHTISDGGQKYICYHANRSRQISLLPATGLTS